MREIVEKLTKKIKKSFLLYTLGMFLSVERRSCVQIARFWKISHDFLYRFLSKADLFLPVFPTLTMSLIKHFSEQKKGWLIIDDTIVSKLYSSFLAGIWQIFNPTTKSRDRGLCLVVLAWSNGNVTIPIAFEWMFARELVQEYYKTKSQIAKELLMNYHKIVPYLYFLADAHYSTRDGLIPFLRKKKIPFVMKITRTRKIHTKKVESQVKNHPALKLYRNQRDAKLRAKYGKYWFYLSVHKRKDKRGEYTYTYLISSMNLDAKEYLEVYDGRWKIEVMFRTLKQHFGLAHCSVRDLDKQKAHIYAIFCGFGFVQNEMAKKNFENSEDTIKYLRKLKSSIVCNRIEALYGNFDHVA